MTTSINGVAVSLQMDSASDITVVSESTWKLLKKPEAKLPSIEAVNASGEPLGLIGEFQCDAAINGVVKQARCFVTSVPDLNVLGIEWIDLFNLWSIPFNAICNHIGSGDKPSTNNALHQLQAKLKFLTNRWVTARRQK